MLPHLLIGGFDKVKQHLQEFDILRTLATFTVIAIHVTAGYVLLSPLGYVGNQLARFAVPLFIILSGFLLYNSDLNGHGLKAIDFYRRRFDRVLWPYILWTLFYALMGGIMAQDIAMALRQLPGHLLWGTAAYHLYFLVIIIQLYLLYPFLRLAIQKWPRLLIAGSFLLTLAAQIMLYLAMTSRIHLNPAYNNFWLVFFPVWVFYFILGMWTAREQQNWQKHLQGKTLWLAVIWIMSVSLLFLDSYCTQTYGSSIRPSVMLYTVSSFFLFYAAALRCRTHKPGWISWVAQQSFLIFLIHPAILTILIYGAAWIGLPDLWSRTRGMIAEYLLLAVLSLLCSYVISLTPLAEKLGGKRAVKIK